MPHITGEQSGTGEVQVFRVLHNSPAERLAESSIESFKAFITLLAPVYFAILLQASSTSVEPRYPPRVKSRHLSVCESTSQV